MSPSAVVNLVTDAKASSKGDTLAVDFNDATFTFHSQWLHDAQVDNGPSKNADDAYSRMTSSALIEEAKVSGRGVKTTVSITWNDGWKTTIPAVWLRVYAPLVAKRHAVDTDPKTSSPTGWLVDTLKIAEVSYADIFAESETSEKVAELICETILGKHSPGILKVVNLPPPDIESERNGANALVSQVLLKLFGNVFPHPRRGSEKTFNVATHQENDLKKGLGLHNYDSTKLLLPHTDQSHYTLPTIVQGLYNLEGESVNTFVSCLAALETFKEEAPDLVDSLYNAPIVMGRVAHWYKPSLYQGTIDTVVATVPGFPDQVQKFRWHPHLIGSLLTPYDQYSDACAAHRKFQEIVDRDTHRLEVQFKPGDLYLFNNFTVLHGRDRVVSEPRTIVGQAVPYQVAQDRYRELQIAKLLPYLEEKWLLHIPQLQLQELITLIDTLDG